MKTAKMIGILLGVYVGLVVVFESLLGYFQPAGQGTLVIATMDDDGDTHARVLSRLASDEAIYVAVNHWPRGWYHQALANPNVQVTIDDETDPYLAVPVSDDEHDALQAQFGHGLVFKILTGFPPRYFVRLDPA